MRRNTRTHQYSGIGFDSPPHSMSSCSTTFILAHVSHLFKLADRVSETLGWYRLRNLGSRATFIRLPGCLRSDRGSKATLRNIGYVVD